MLPADDQVTLLDEVGETTNQNPVGFTTTYWSIILAAQGATLAGVEKLCRAYWRPHRIWTLVYTTDSVAHGPRTFAATQSSGLGFVPFEKSGLTARWLVQRGLPSP